MQILIVGAGPVGLALACDLQRRQIPFRIVDKNANITELSKAFGIQSGTLRCLDATLGSELTQRLVTAGFRAQQATMHFDDARPAALDLSSIPEPYPFVLILEQNKTEHFLEDDLNSRGGKVERGKEVASVSLDGQVEFSDGEKTQFDYVVGCDGAHSIVREAMDEKFVGGQYEATFSLADVELKWPLERGVRGFIQPHGFFVVFPYQQAGRARIIYVLKGPARQDELDLATCQNEIREITSLAPEISQPKWLTRFRIHHRMVKHFQKERLFLAGDAAHIHSPVGGQGMNLGIQDALNLSAKMAKGEKALARYSRERARVARRIVNTTDRVTRLGLAKDSWWLRFGRRFVAPRLITIPLVARFVARQISQFEMSKKEIAGYEIP